MDWILLLAVGYVFLKICGKILRKLFSPGTTVLWLVLGTVLCEPVVARPVDSRMEVPFYADRQLLREAAMPEKKKWRNSQQ